METERKPNKRPYVEPGTLRLAFLLCEKGPVLIAVEQHFDDAEMCRSVTMAGPKPVNLFGDLRPTAETK